MTALGIAFVVLGALLLLAIILWLVACWCEESETELEVARINRERRRAEAQINRQTIAAMQQMTDIARHAQNRRKSS